MFKKIALSAVMLLTFSGLMPEIPPSAGAANNRVEKQVAQPAKVEVYYFHFTRRCTTCKAVETESKSAITSLYPTQLKEGMITYKSVNLDDKSSAALAKRCKVEGQALLVLSERKRVDLTEQGFMFAVDKPARLKAELKKAIDPMLSR